MSDPKDRYINPGIGYYGRSVKIDDACYIATGRTGDMTNFYEHTPATFGLSNHACVCDLFDMNADDHVSDSFRLGSGQPIGHFDATTKRVFVDTTGDENYINLQHPSIQSSNAFTQPASFLFATWFKPTSLLTTGQPEINILDHRANGSGNVRYGYILSISSNTTNNDGTLSVLVGRGDNNGWNTYKVSGMNTWLPDTRYHVALLKIGNNLKVYINNQLQLEATTSAIVSSGEQYVSINMANSVPPVAIERYTYTNNIPDLPVTFIEQHYNKIKVTSKST